MHNASIHVFRRCNLIKKKEKKDGCDTFPKTPVTFSELKLVGTDGARINATWLANPKPAKDLQCKEATQINGPDNVVISFR